MTNVVKMIGPDFEDEFYTVEDALREFVKHVELNGNYSCSRSEKYISYTFDDGSYWFIEIKE